MSLFLIVRIVWMSLTVFAIPIIMMSIHNGLIGQVNTMSRSKKNTIFDGLTRIKTELQKLK